MVSLCERYWYPLYAYVRRSGYPADQAQDLTQEFFTRVLEGRYLDRANPEKGRFRSFLLTSLKFFVSDAEDRQRARTRGGGQLASLEFSSGEERYLREPAHDADCGIVIQATRVISRDIVTTIAQRVHKGAIRSGTFVGKKRVRLIQGGTEPQKRAIASEPSALKTQHRGIGQTLFQADMNDAEARKISVLGAERPIEDIDILNQFRRNGF